MDYGRGHYKGNHIMGHQQPPFRSVQDSHKTQVLGGCPRDTLVLSHLLNLIVTTLKGTQQGWPIQGRLAKNSRLGQATKWHSPASYYCHLHQPVACPATASFPSYPLSSQPLQPLAGLAHSFLFYVCRSTEKTSTMPMTGKPMQINYFNM